MANRWKHQETRSNEAWAEFELKDKTYYAKCKFDGCVDLYRLYNGTTYDEATNTGEDIDYLHICDLTEFIAHLIALHGERIAHFGTDPDR